jgi:uncharacterized protein with von Willebrand factor type A (vWA) domain
MQDTYDFVSHLTRFCRVLREHGLLIGPGEIGDAVRAVSLVDLMAEGRIYWTLRTLLVSRHEQLSTFETLFARFWSFQTMPAKPSQADPWSRVGPNPTVGRYPRSLALPDHDPGSQATLIQMVRTGASAAHVTSVTSPAATDGHGSSELARIAAAIVRALASRPGRRRKRHRRKGTADLRGAMRLSLATGGDAVRLPRLRRAPRVPRLLVLLDVSGSMDRHSRLLLELAYAVGQRTRRIEVFAFSTTVSRITRELSAPSFGEALERVSRSVDHWSGGTRIGESLDVVNAAYPHLLDRYTTVFLLSDGWETGDPGGLARALRRMRRRVRGVVWLNPLLDTVDFQPLAGGLAAALPHVDHFVPAGGVEDLKRLPPLLR